MGCKNCDNRNEMGSVCNIWVEEKQKAQRIVRNVDKIRYHREKCSTEREGKSKWTIRTNQGSICCDQTLQQFPHRLSKTDAAASTQSHASACGHHTAKC
jgi:hypothetical protein